MLLLHAKLLFFFGCPNRIFVYLHVLWNDFEKSMIEVKSKKPLLEAIQNGEQFIKITDPKFLLACLVAEEWDNDKTNVKKFLNVILGSKNVIDMQDRPQIRVGLVNEKGKVWRMFINKREKFGGCSSIFRYVQRLSASSIFWMIHTLKSR